MNVLFVCTGNTCRSPMLKYMFENFVEKKGLKINVDSAGMIDHKKPMNVNTQIVLIQHGIKFDQHESKCINQKLFDKQDYIFVMSQNIKDELGKIYGENAKIVGLNELCGDDIFDPYGLGVEAYSKVYNIFEEILEKIFNCIENKI